MKGGRKERIKKLPETGVPSQWDLYLMFVETEEGTFKAQNMREE